MTKDVTIGQMTDALVRLGFGAIQAHDGHRVFKHSKTGTLVVLPRSRRSQKLGRARFAAIRFSIIGREVATAEQFDDAVDAVPA